MHGKNYKVPEWPDGKSSLNVMASR